MRRGEAENPNSQARLGYSTMMIGQNTYRYEGRFNNSLFESAHGTARFEGTLVHYSMQKPLEAVDQLL